MSWNTDFEDQIVLMVQAEDLKPRGVLHHACITAPAEGEEFQQQLPEAVRRQYLHELFPDLSLEENFKDDPDHQELIVPREELVDHLRAGNSSFLIDYTRCDPTHVMNAVCIAYGCYSCKSGDTFMSCLLTCPLRQTFKKSQTSNI